MRRTSITGRLLLIFAVLLAAAMVWGVAAATAASPSPSPAQVVLRVGWTAEPDNLNPFIGWANTTYEIWALNYDFLFGFGLNGGQATLDLAAEFPTQANGGISPNGKVWTIHLRPGVRWSDGQLLTAADVAFTYNYVVKNQMANMALATVGITGARAIDPTTVQITCSQPKADMEHIFLPILPKHVWEHVSPRAAATSYVSAPPIVGSGPFSTTAFKKGTYVEMVRNPYYWGKKPTVDKILFEMYQDADSMVADLKSGNLDGAWGIPQAQFKPVTSQPGISTIAYNFFNWDYIDVNCSAQPGSTGNPVLRDARFRNALNYAIDRAKLAQLAYQGLAAPATSIMPPDTWSNPDYHWQPPADQAYPFDLAQANRLLDAAGYARAPSGLRLSKGKPISLRLWSTTDFQQAQLEAKLIAGWLQKLGLKVTLSVLDRGTVYADMFNYKGATVAPDYDLFVDDWAGFGDPGQTLTAFTTAGIGATNEPAWSNAAFDALTFKQATTLDPSRRNGFVQQAQKLFHQQSPQVVLVYPKYLEAYNTARWTGWTPMLDGRGPVFMTTGNVDSYLNLRPVTGSTSGGGAKGATIAIAVVIVVVLAGLSIWLVRRHRAGVEET